MGKFIKRKKQKNLIIVTWVFLYCKASFSIWCPWPSMIVRILLHKIKKCSHTPMKSLLYLFFNICKLYKKLQLTMHHISKLGPRPTTRDARKIDFWVVHVVAQVAAHKTRWSLSIDHVVADIWRHGKFWTWQTSSWTPWAKKQDRENSSVGCGNPSKD